MSSGPAIEARQLGKRYGRRVGLEKLDLTVGAGETFGFLGPNGAGKTTAIRLLLGFLRPTGGRARILDLDCWRDSHRIKRQVGYLPGDVRLYRWLDVRAALKLLSLSHGVDVTASGMEIAARLELDPDVRAQAMSRGMRQKLGLLLALARPSRVLVLDEPTGGLDPLVQRTLAEILRERAAEGGTVFFSSHSLAEVEQLCDRVAVMRRGKLVTVESMESLRSRARRRVEVRFAGPEQAAIEAPSFLARVERRGIVWSADLEGQPASLARWVDKAGVRDFSLSPPDLETLFHRYYTDDESA